MHISMMLFSFKAIFRQEITGKGCYPGLETVKNLVSMEFKAS